LIYLTKEQELILLCSRFTLNEIEENSLIELLHAPLRWKDILNMAWRNKLAPLLFKHFQNDRIRPHISKNILKTVTNIYYGNLARNIIFSKELQKFLSEFENANIPVLILKGGFLSQILYEDPAFRFMSDIDLLVKKSDLNKVHEISEKLGYSFIKRQQDKEFYEKYHFHFAYEKLTAPKLVFEFHWNLIKPSSKLNINPDDLWEQTFVFDFYGREARALSLENQFLHLIIHAAHDCFEHGLISICEISEFYKKYQNVLNIPKIKHLAFKIGANKMFYYILYHTEKIMGNKFHPHLVWQFRPHPISSYFLERVLDLKVILNGSISKNPAFIYLPKLFMFNNPLDSLLLLYNILFPSEEFMMEIFQTELSTINPIIRIKIFLLSLKLYFSIFKQSLKT
jgi:hypothetical protein